MAKDWLQLYPKECKKEIRHASAEETLAASMERSALRFRDKPCITTLGLTLTYQQTFRQARNLAAYLQNKMGLATGDVVAIILPNIVPGPIAFFAAQLASLKTVWINPEYTPREIAKVISDCKPHAAIILEDQGEKLSDVLRDSSIKHVITTSIADSVPNWRAMLTNLLRRPIAGSDLSEKSATTWGDAIRHGADLDLTRPKQSSSDVCLLQYTGGTTGVSKAAMLSHGNILANIEQVINSAASHVLEGRESVLVALPLYHVLGLVVNFLTFFHMGQHLILVPKPTPVRNVIDAFRRHRPGIIIGVNTLFRSLSQSGEFRQLAPTNIKIAFAGGMALQESVADEWQKATGSRIIQGYGLTEAGPVTHVTPLTVIPWPRGTIGIPVASTDARIVDPAGNEVPHGEAGELIIRGPQVMAGYLNHPDETAGVIRGEWLYTGDYARRNGEGWFFLLDRKKDMVIISGFNVYPTEIEEVISTHPGVRECAAVGLRDRDGSESLRLFIVKSNDELSIDSIRTFCRENLAAYKIPRDIEFVTNIPKSPIGKILRRELLS